MSVTFHTKILKSFKTVTAMMRDRGNVPKTTLNETSTVEDWREKFQNPLNNPKITYNCNLVYVQPDGTKGCVYWPKDPKIGVESVKYFTSLSEKNNMNAFILVVTESITTQSRKDIEENIKYVYNAEYFYLEKLLINITKHKFVPKHIRLSEEERDKIVAQYNTGIENFPQILDTDPIARYYNFKPGELIKIERYFDHYSGKLDYTKKPDISYCLVVKPDLG